MIRLGQQEQTEKTEVALLFRSKSPPENLVGNERFLPLVSGTDRCFRALFVRLKLQCSFPPLPLLAPVRNVTLAGPELEPPVWLFFLGSALQRPRDWAVAARYELRLVISFSSHSAVVDRRYSRMR